MEISNAGVAAIKCVVKDAFRLTEDGFSLLSRLQKAALPPSVMDLREVREINKLGNYWRICLSLAHVSRAYRSLFATIRLETTERFAASIAYGNTITRYVHAEVQMLIHYEIKRCATRPRAIGVSKEACFLCNSLIRAHALFYVSKAHRQVFNQWTVPDLSDYRPESRERLQKALQAVRRDVNSVLQQARHDRSFRPYPLQSSRICTSPCFRHLQ